MATFVIHGLGEAPQAVGVDAGETIETLTSRVSGGDPAARLIEREAEEDLALALLAVEALKDGAHVLLRRRCKRIEVRVRFGGLSETHDFSAAATVGAVLVWAEEKFGIVPSQRGQYRLKLQGSDAYLDNDLMLEELVKGGDCKLVLELVRQEHNAGAYDAAALAQHLAGVDFQRGLLNGRWRPACIGEGIVTISIATGEAEPRSIGLRLDIDGYPATAPLGTFWDLERDCRLPNELWPRLPDGNQAFRTDWNNGLGLYIACDRSGLASHSDWANSHPNTNWRPDVGIARYLAVVAGLLSSAMFARRAA